MVTLSQKIKKSLGLDLGFVFFETGSYIAQVSFKFDM